MDCVTRTSSKRYTEKSSGIVWTEEMPLQNFAAYLLYHYDENNKPVFKVFSYGVLMNPNLMELLKDENESLT